MTHVKSFAFASKREGFFLAAFTIKFNYEELIMRDIIEKIEIIMKDNNGILVYFTNDLRLFIKLDLNSLIHCFGLKKILKYQKFSNENLINKIKDGKISIFSIQSDRTIDKLLKKQINDKIKAFKSFVKYQSNDNIHVFKNIQFYHYHCDFVLKKGKYLLCLEKHFKEKDFYSVHIKSIRKNVCKLDNQKFKITKSDGKIEKYKIIAHKRKN